MNSLFSILQCVLRLSFALILGQAVTREIFTADPDLAGAVAVRTPDLATSLVCLVLAVVTIWLILGIGTRAVALLGLGLYLAHEMVLRGFEVLSLQLSQDYGCILAATLALPLVFFGGGRFSVIPSQGQEPV